MYKFHRICKTFIYSVVTESTNPIYFPVVLVALKRDNSRGNDNIQGNTVTINSLYIK